FLCYKRRAAAFQILSRYGLPPTTASADRLRLYLQGVRARLVLIGLYQESTGKKQSGNDLVDDEELLSILAAIEDLVEMLLSTWEDPALDRLQKPVIDVLARPARAAALTDGLRKSAARAEALLRFQNTLQQLALLEPAWLSQAQQRWREGHSAVA